MFSYTTFEIFVKAFYLTVALGPVGGVYALYSTPSCFGTSSNNLFLNSVSLSDRIFSLPPNLLYTFHMYAYTTSSAVLVFNGMQNT